MNYHKKLLPLFILFYSILPYAQSYKKDSLRGEFVYQLKAKFDTRTENRHEELFLLQLADNRAFFVSSVSLKGDSVMANSGTTTHNSDGSITLGWKKDVVIPKTNFNFIIIQANENIQFFDHAGMSLLTYKEPVIKTWKLVDETKVINTINCKKAEVSFKGRNWIAWYSPEIPFPYGPMKFSGLPGLIIKITDDKGDYDFELVKSVPVSKLKGKVINIKKSRYTEAIETTQPKLKEAVRNADANAAAALASYGTTIIKGQEMLREREKQREENKKYENPLELSN
ncbi:MULTISPECIES: GLPGLI family protein [Chryseobacterium]|jgi:GLPGLI family protein|uniref:GLPGLI family protein n=1 Tax=Chryseobacterium geocarposphaerae TaxID=1416776 RepID=A0ABU1L9L7_9FLAO|nr:MULTISPECIES: GLPGLI family protein [Chryseobacterium]MDR6403401.1 GLPGLI family protein [Chryseobacterium geocarposphaerae]MDR6696955.1 GLPGLI family protein [Chryseobacterium ginsenosidimutans]